MTQIVLALGTRAYHGCERKDTNNTDHGTDKRPVRLQQEGGAAEIAVAAVNTAADAAAEWR